MASSGAETIDFGDLIATLWRSKWLILAITVASAAASVLLAISLPNVYRASATLVPAPTQSTDQLGALPGSLRSLASLAGAPLGGGGGANKVNLAMEVLQSRQFITRFIERHNVLVPLFAVERWDARSGQLIYDPDVYDVTSRRWVRKVAAPRKPMPSNEEAYEEFIDRLGVGLDEKTGFVTVSFEFYSPELAATWVRLMIRDMNETLRRRDIRDSSASISYLEQQLQRTNLADIQTIFYKLIESQIQKKLLAATSAEYVLQTLDPAVTPERKVGPMRALICVLGTVGGFLLACLMALTLGTIRRAKERRAAA